MIEEYYVIVNLDTLQYMQDGEGVNLKEADKFDTYEEAKQDLSTYDSNFNGAVYKVKEYREFTVEKVKE